MSARDHHHLVELTVADDGARWAAAGFTVEGDSVVVGPTRVRLVGGDEPRGIRSAAVHGLDGAVDGLPFTAADVPEPAAPTTHDNRVVDLDHLVALSPDMDRTTAALEQAGLEVRRSRRFEVDGAGRRQTFFWLGTTILEVAGADTPTGDGPAMLWGLAFTCDDLDTAASRLGDRLGRPRDAVQAGRRIASLRTNDLDISVPIALMSPHPQSPAPR